ncbi:hypothetical protein A3D84_04755 [Candidatus Woesebacteria bacterium RIFCSPHIGHO2_02_FULL_42_20]|nr:MAG: hypothetical protein A2873_05170 [Candidatus Woesebacteria bacterium RIFCSPHIGHO2_01_FULL_42_80]OGM34329.1 MAG: hypothetical protein A3D84_04755 [Candidatus Woesebacteria bacterium RIFCSPHIGHO2_02_FULL_42_20]OGM67813.1 MAG: hypothetical protein A2969_02330 [Candidatus Woesebacteria bacterium RIFCSPLOWO2_01_FULL_42_67]
MVKRFNILYRTLYDGKIKLNKEELAGGRWFMLSEVKRMLRRQVPLFLHTLSTCLKLGISV